MFGNLGLPELAVIALFGLVIFGPDRLPKAAAEAARMIRRLRAMSDSAMGDLKSGLGPEFADVDLRSLHPRRMVQDAWNGVGDDWAHAADQDHSEGGSETPVRRPTAASRPRRKSVPRTGGPAAGAASTSSKPRTSQRTGASTRAGAEAKPPHCEKRTPAAATRARARRKATTPANGRAKRT